MIDKISLRIPDVIDLSNQDRGPLTTGSLVSSLPLPLRSQMGMTHGEEITFDKPGMII